MMANGKTVYGHAHCTDETCVYGDTTCPKFVPMIGPRKGDWMQTFTGVAFYPLDPRPEEIHSVDIAHALSMLCRYNGHVRDFYSVAQHCVLISQWLENEGASRQDCLWGLLHDAPEAYIGDMTRPLKRYMPTFRKVDDDLMLTICLKYGIPTGMPEIVKEADNRILLNERAVLLGTPPQEWHQDRQKIEPLAMDPVEPWSPRQAESFYITRLDTLLSSRSS
jgi:hypothetical protein